LSPVKTGLALAAAGIGGIGHVERTLGRLGDESIKRARRLD